jgi:hypothetical protein
MRGMLIVTTQILPVNGSAQNNQPHLFLISFISRDSLQHKDLVSDLSLHVDIKLAKYGIQYFHVALIIGSKHSLSQGNSLSILYVGIGKENGLHLASHSRYTCHKALFIISISF